VMSKRLNRPDSHSDASGFAPGRATRAYARVREPSQGPRWFPAPPGRGTGLEGPRGGGPTPLREGKRLDRNNRLDREVQVALQESPLRGGASARATRGSTGPTGGPSPAGPPSAHRSGSCLERGFREWRRARRVQGRSAWSSRWSPRRFLAGSLRSSERSERAGRPRSGPRNQEGVEIPTPPSGDGAQPVRTSGEGCPCTGFRRADRGWDHRH
jgi:hypothetical protein